MKYVSQSIKDTSRIAKKFLTALSRRRDQGTLVLLSGDLGAGKTAFVKQVAKILGMKEKIISPTFVLMRKYRIPARSKFPFSHLFHIDAYRLEGRREFKALGWDEIIRDPSNIIFLEWPEKVFTRVPRGAIKIKFKFINETTREISF